MQIRWPNGVLDLGFLPFCDGYGVSLAWGRRDLMGEDVGEFDVLYADHKYAVLATGRDIRVHGSVWRAVVCRWIFLMLRWRL